MTSVHANVPPAALVAASLSSDASPPWYFGPGISAGSPESANRTT